MPTFVYSAASRDGSMKEGMIDSPNRASALRSLVEAGLQPFQLDISDTAPVAPTAESSPITKPTITRGMTRGEVLRFTDELADLLEAGLQVEPALNVMSKSQGGVGRKGEYSEIVGRIADKVREGSGVAQALKSGGDHFDPLYRNLVEAGEASGTLGSILGRQRDHLRTMEDLRSQVVSAMLYPAFLLMSGMALVALFVGFLVPKLERLMMATGGELSWGARRIIAGSGFLSSWWWLLLILAVLLVIGIRRSLSLPAVRRWWDERRFAVPVLGGVWSAQFHVYFLETLGNLVANGLPLLRGIELAGGATSNLHLREKLSKMAAEVADGTLLSTSMERADVFDQHAIDRVRIGEQSGAMAQSIQKAAARSDRSLSEKITRMGELVQPAIIVLMAGLVGVVAYLMIGIIYDSITGLQ